ncbi:MAG: CBS domain-containing protein [Chloroflexota bacterium]
MTLRVRGVRIRATLGWLVTYLLLVAMIVLWQGPPGEASGSAAARAVAVLLVPILLWPTLVAHELAHLLVARRNGRRPDVVDLRLVGMSRGHATGPGGPGAELRIALAGPLASLAIGAVLFAASHLLGPAGDVSGLLGWTLSCVAAANVVLGLVSLYPGHPMDGSDVTHAVAWRLTGSPRRAARAVVVVGVATSWAVMLAGLGVALRVDPTAGMWLTLLGWSLGRVARLARDQDRLVGLVSGLTVADATERDVAVVSPTLTLDTMLAQHRLAEGPGMFPVVRGGTLVGVIDVRDVGGAGRPGTDLRVADRMRSIDRVPVVTEGQRLWDAVAVLERDRLAAVPVVAPDDRGRLLGLVTRQAVQRVLRTRLRRADAPATADDADDGPDARGPRA